MKKTLVTLLLLLASSLALALPAPKDIDAAVKAGHLAQAESMLHEVIQAKPGSAKAHYELGQVLAMEGKPAVARQELQEAERIDPALKFATDPLHFRNLMNQVNAAAGKAAGATAKAAPQAPQAAPAMVPAPQATGGFPWTYVLLGGGFLLVLWLVLRRAAAPAVPTVAQPAPGAMTAGGYGANYGGTGFGNNYGAGAPAAPAGSGIGSAVLGGVAGLAAGYGLAKMLDSRDEGGAGGSGGGHGGSPSGNTLTPIEPAPDYGAFDAGRGDDWDSGADDSGSGGDSW